MIRFSLKPRNCPQNSDRSCVFQTVLLKAGNHIGTLSCETPQRHGVLSFSFSAGDAAVVALPCRLSITFSNLPEPVPLHTLLGKSSTAWLGTKEQTHLP